MIRTNLPVLTRLVRENSVDFSATTLYIIHHLKANVVGFIRYLKQAGFARIVVIGKPYSREAGAEVLFRKYATVHTPTFEELEKPEYIRSIVAESIQGKAPFLCFDMSGYFSRYFALYKRPYHFLGIIEETRNGLWFDENRTFDFPLLSVASSVLKDYGETYHVARAILRNSEHTLINSRQQTFVGQNVLILGYGVIGRHIARILKTSAQVTVFDIEPTRLFRARAEGLRVLTNLRKLDTFDSIIGITGAYPLGKELMRLKQDVVLINGSTGKREFNLDAIAPAISRSEYSKYATIIHLKNHKRLHFLAHGFPINFFHTESIPEPILDVVYSEVFLLAQILKLGKAPNGYHPIEALYPDLEDHVANMWLDIHT